MYRFSGRPLENLLIRKYRMGYLAIYKSLIFLTIAFFLRTVYSVGGCQWLNRTLLTVLMIRKDLGIRSMSDRGRSPLEPLPNEFPFDIRKAYQRSRTARPIYLAT